MRPVVSSTVENDLIDFGYALVRDPCTTTFKVTAGILNSIPCFVFILSIDCSYQNFSVEVLQTLLSPTLDNRS